jgi:hypothetical protein
LLQFSNRFLTTQDVIDEVRGKGQRERLEQEWKMLDATLNNSTGQSGDEWTGLQVREPSAVGISKSELAHCFSIPQCIFFFSISAWVYSRHR